MRIPGVLCLYFALHVICRCLVSDNLQLDEAEQVILAQDWRLGYGSQPPLYTWIQKSAFTIFGLNVFSLSIVKNVCLFSIYLFVFLTAKQMFDKIFLAEIATLSMLFIPQLAWESQRDQTHLVLATACAAATLYFFSRMIKNGEARWHILFGLVSGLGVLAKYNFGIFPVALLIAAALSKSTRQLIYNRRLIIGLVVFLPVVAPHAWWAFGNKALVTSQSYKFKIQNDGDWVTSLMTVFQFLKASVAYIAAPLLVFFLATRGDANGQFSPARAGSGIRESVIIKAMVIGLGMVLALSLGFGVTNLRDRWLQPILFPLPLALVAVAQRKLNERAWRHIAGVAGFVALTVLSLINGTVVFANLIGRAHNLNFPSEKLAMRIRDTGFSRGIIIADGFFLGGNLKMRFKESYVAVPESQHEPQEGLSEIFVWRASGNAVPPFVSDAHHYDRLAPEFFEIPHQNGSRRSERLGIALLRSDK